MIEVYDVGGTSLRGALLAEDGGLLKKIKISSEQDFCRQIRKASHEFHNERPDRLVVVVPGPVKDGVLLKAPPLGITEPVNVQEELKELSDVVIVENDMNAAAQAELCYGIGWGCSNFYLLTISTGIGVGIVLNGKVLGGMSGEFGHNVIETREAILIKCGCGNSGCWASLASGKGIENLAMRYCGVEMKPEIVFERYLYDKSAKKIVEMVRDYNARGIGMMINALEVQAISVMGSVGRNQFEMIIPSREEIARYTVNPVPPIMKTKLSDDIGLLGGYAIGAKR